MSDWTAVYRNPVGDRRVTFSTTPPQQPMPVAERLALPGDVRVQVMRRADFLRDPR